MTTRPNHDSLRVPSVLRNDVEQIYKLTDPFCAKYLDAEYGELVRKLVAKLARKRNSPLARGNLHIWAGAAIYAVGSVNFLFDRTQTPHMTGDDLSALIGVPKSTLANKAKMIRDVLHMSQLDPEFCRRELRASNPLSWMFAVNGFIVDARMMPPAFQVEAWRHGLIPDLPHEKTGVSSEKPTRQRKRDAREAGPGKPTDAGAPAMFLAKVVDDIIDNIRCYSTAGQAGDGWDLIVRTIAENDSLPASQLQLIEKAIAKAYEGWSDAQRRSIWCQTESGMANDDDEDDDDLCDMSISGLGDALRVELLDEVTHTAWCDAADLKAAAAKRSPRRRGRAR